MPLVLDGVRFELDGDRLVKAKQSLYSVHGKTRTDDKGRSWEFNEDTRRWRIAGKQQPAGKPAATKQQPKKGGKRSPVPTPFMSDSMGEAGKGKRVYGQPKPKQDKKDALRPRSTESVFKQKGKDPKNKTAPKGGEKRSPSKTYHLTEFKGLNNKQTNWYLNEPSDKNLAELEESVGEVGVNERQVAEMVHALQKQRVERSKIHEAIDTGFKKLMTDLDEEIKDAGIGPEAGREIVAEYQGHYEAIKKKIDASSTADSALKPRSKATADSAARSGGALVPSGGKLTVRDSGKKESEDERSSNSRFSAERRAIDEKYFSENASDEDAQAWIDEVIRLPPNRKDVEVKVLDDLLLLERHWDPNTDITTTPNIRDKDGWIKLQIKKRSRMSEKNFDWKSHLINPLEYYQKDIDRLEKKIAKGKGTPADEAKLKKVQDKRDYDVDLSKQVVEKLKKQQAKTPEQQYEHWGKLYDADVDKRMEESQKIHEGVKRGRKSAIADATFEAVSDLPVNNLDEDRDEGGNANIKIVRDYLRGKASSDEDFFGLKPGFTQKDLKAAYRKASLKAHPDSGGSDEQFRRVVSVYRRLNQQFNDGY